MAEYIEIERGKLYWRFDSPVITESQDYNLARPILLFIHAGVSDHTLWDEQVAFYTIKGWGCLRYDLFGFGKSLPDPHYSACDPLSPIKHHDHAAKVVEAYNDSLSGSKTSDTSRFVVVGLSRGGGIAVDFTLSHPDVVDGLVICAGGIGGFDSPNTPAEDSVFNKLEAYLSMHDTVNATLTVSRFKRMRLRNSHSFSVLKFIS